MEGGREDKAPATLPGHEGNEAPDEGLDDFASLAESYLLADPGLASDFAGVSDEEFGASLAKAPGDAEGRRSGLANFLWDPSANETTRSTDMAWEKNAAGGKSGLEAKDSSNWELSRKHRGSLPSKHRSESPNSGMLSATSTPLQMARQSTQSLRVENVVDVGKRAESPFLARMPCEEQGHGVLESKQTHVQSFSRLMNERAEGIDPADAYDWPSADYAGYPPYSHPEFITQMPPSHMRGSRGGWGSADFQDMSTWNRMREARAGMQPYRNSEAPLEGILEHAGPDRCHSQGDALGEHTPLRQPLQSRVASSMDDVCIIPRPKNSRHGMSAPLFSPQQPGTPSEAYSAERKRKRPADAMFAPAAAISRQDPIQHGHPGGSAAPNSYISSSSSPIAHEDLIRTLKGQIESLDSQTKGILKDTLYRISRHTNAANGGVEGSRSRHSQRSQYLDRLVANILYNRFPDYPPEHSRPGGGPFQVAYGGGYAGRGGISNIKPLLP